MEIQDEWLMAPHYRSSKYRREFLSKWKCVRPELGNTNENIHDEEKKIKGVKGNVLKKKKSCTDWTEWWKMHGLLKICISYRPTKSSNSFRNGCVIQVSKVPKKKVPKDDFRISS